MLRSVSPVFSWLDVFLEQRSEQEVSSVIHRSVTKLDALCVCVWGVCVGCVCVCVVRQTAEGGGAGY